MKVLIAEDDSSIASQYKLALEARKHDVILTENGQECLSVYRDALKQAETQNKNGSPFDVVVLDYRMPGMDGMEVAREILHMNPDQRIVFASAYVKESLAEAVQMLKQLLEFMQKPFRLASLVGTIEDKKICEELHRINTQLRTIENLRLTNQQLLELLAGLNRIQKGRDHLFDGLSEIEKAVQEVCVQLRN